MHPTLFGPDAPSGFHYRADVITVAEEAVLASEIDRLEFANFEMRGVVARRRVAFFGQTYREGAGPSPPMPAFLNDVRARAAEWAGVAPDAFAMALINEYRGGAPIGWHRDAPQYGIVAGISLLSACEMRFRPYLAPRALVSEARPTRRKTTHQITLAPRSGYVMTGESRSSYEHSIPEVATLRYSITFRTLRS